MENCGYACKIITHTNHLANYIAIAIIIVGDIIIAAVKLYLASSLTYLPCAPVAIFTHTVALSKNLLAQQLCSHLHECLL